MKINFEHINGRVLICFPLLFISPRTRNSIATDMIVVTRNSQNMFVYAVSVLISREYGKKGVWEEMKKPSQKRYKKILIAIAWMMAFCFHTWVAIFSVQLCMWCICDWCSTPTLQFYIFPLASMIKIINVTLRVGYK